MTRIVRLFLLVEAGALLAASFVHSGYLITGYEHAQARIAEGIIGLVLVAGLVGAFTIAVGIGPRTVPDVVFHAGLVILLVWGLALTARGRSGAGRDW
ncbi:MAG TPA: hypothetical protein VFG66_04575 [Gemmatimonadales bacterium]|nr:hypothetical protein [Gemmatimonadales bacterium]